MESKKFTKSTWTGILFAILIVLLIVVTVLVNMVASGLSDKYPLTADLTANASYQIGEDTKQVLSSLTTDIDLIVLATENQFTGNSYLVQFRRILEEYPKYSDRVHLRYVDTASDPTFAASYPDLELNEADTLVVSTFGIKQLPVANMFTYTYTESGDLTVNACRAEEALTSAIAGVLTAEHVKVGFLTGNGAGMDTETFRSILANNNFETGEVNMVQDDFSDYDILILRAPETDPSEEVLSKLDDFLYNQGQFGKTLLYAADVSQTGDLPNLNAFLREWGIAVEDGAVFETSMEKVYSYQPYYPYAEYSESTYSARLKDDSNPFLAPLAKPLSVVFEFKDYRTVTELLAFGETAGVRPSDAPDTFTASQATIWGPMPAMLMSTWQTGKSEYPSQVIVSASASAFGGTTMGNTSFSNSEYIVNLFNTLTDREGTVAIEAKSLAGNTLTVSTAEASRLGLTLCVIVPLVILVTGIVLSLRRRYK